MNKNSIAITLPSKGKTQIDEYVEALIQNTADGNQLWHADMSGKPLRYYYNTGFGSRIYIAQNWITANQVLFALHIAYGEKYEHEVFIANELTPQDQPNQLRELWLAAQENTTEEGEQDFDFMAYFRQYAAETKRKNTFDELCRILICVSEEIIELFQKNES